MARSSLAASRLQHLNMPPILAYLLSYIISWRSLALVLAVLNLKSLPLAWHARLFALMIKHGRPLRRNLSFLRSRPAKPDTENKLEPSSDKESIHPIFRPVTITSRVSLYETDYNLHKSNSTYFADLDHSRTALVASLLTPALAHSTLTKQGEKPGILYPILGSVHTSFLREIKPLQSYSIRSRLLGWDRKWLVIASYFVRPATKQEKSRAKREGKPEPKEILLACALNKYVVKQGRKTIEPGLALAGSGWFRARKGITHAITDSTTSSTPNATTTEEPKTTGLEESAIVISKPQDTEQAISSSGTETPNPLPTPSNATIQTAQTVSNVVRRLSSASRPDFALSSSNNSNNITNNTSKDDDEDDEVGGYKWSAIEAERKRGMKVAEAWMGLDTDLREEYERAVLEGIVVPGPL